MTEDALKSVPVPRTEPQHHLIRARGPTRVAAALAAALPEEARGIRPEDLFLAEPTLRVCRVCRRPFTTSARARWVCDDCVGRRKEEIEAQERRNELREMGVTGRLAEMTLERFDRRWQPEAMDAVERLLAGTTIRPLTLLGLSGTGKTHLACGVLLRCRELGMRGRYKAMPALVTAYSTAREFRDWGAEAIGPLLSVPVLVLDDWGDEKETAVLAPLMLSIIDERWAKERATIVTSSLVAPRPPGWTGDWTDEDRIRPFLTRLDPKIARRLLDEGELVIMRERLYRPPRR